MHASTIRPTWPLFAWVMALMLALLSACGTPDVPPGAPPGAPPVTTSQPTSPPLPPGTRQPAPSPQTEPSQAFLGALQFFLDQYDQHSKTDDKALAGLSPGMRTLFQQRQLKGNALAVPLADTLKSIREPITTAPSTGQPGGNDPAAITARMLLEVAAKAAVQQLNEKLLQPPRWQDAGASVAASDAHMRRMLDRNLPTLLASETLVLRAFPGMTDDDARRILRMAMLKLGVRLSSKMLQQSEQDYAGAEARFTALLAQREQAARLLADALAALQGLAPGRRPTGDAALLQRAFSRDELARLARELAVMSPSDFAQNSWAQEMALKLLRVKDPRSYQDYVQQRSLAVQQTRQHVQAVTGVAAFVGFSLAYARDALELVNKHGGKALLSMAPSLVDFGIGAYPVMASMNRTLESGLLPALLQRDGGFLVTLDGQTRVVPQASELFQTLQQSGALPKLATGLFMQGGHGWLAKLRMCDARAAGLMMDKATTVEQRSTAALAYLGEPARAQIGRTYRFETALPAPTLGPAERRMHDELLSHDQRQRATHPALGELQRQVSQGYTAWNNEALMRLIFANREAGAAQAALYVGPELVIRPRASAQAVYLYQDYEDSCTAGVRRPAAP